MYFSKKGISSILEKNIEKEMGNLGEGLKIRAFDKRITDVVGLTFDIEKSNR